MRTLADTALRSVIGLFVVTAMLVTIWVARDSSARAGVAESASDTGSPAFDPARIHRAGHRAGAR